MLAKYLLRCKMDELSGKTMFVSSDCFHYTIHKGEKGRAGCAVRADGLFGFKDWSWALVVDLLGKFLLDPHQA